MPIGAPPDLSLVPREVQTRPISADFRRTQQRIFTSKTEWRSGVGSNSRSRLFSAKTANFRDFPFSAREPAAPTARNFAPTAVNLPDLYRDQDRAVLQTTR